MSVVVEPCRFEFFGLFLSSLPDVLWTEAMVFVYGLCEAHG